MLLRWGHGTLIERGQAQIFIRHDKPRRLRIYELDTAGRRLRPLPCTRSRDGIAFTVSTDNEDGQGRIYYEIAVK